MTCKNCGTGANHSDRTGCCGGCKRLFRGQGAFDRHWVTTEAGTRVCVDPLSVVDSKGGSVFESIDVKGGVAWRIKSKDTKKSREWYLELAG